MKIVGFDIYKRFIRNNQFHFSFFLTKLDIFLFFINETIQKQVHVIMHWDFQKDAPNELVCLHVFVSNTAFSVSLQWRSPIQCLHNLNRNEYTRNLQFYENVPWKMVYTMQWMNPFYHFIAIVYLWSSEDIYLSGITPKMIIEDVLPIFLFPVIKSGHFNGISSFVNFVFLTLGDTYLTFNPTYFSV